MSPREAGRKMVYVIVAMMISSVLAGLRAISSQEWVEFNKWLGIAFCAANAVEHVANGKTKPPSAPPA